MNRSNREKQLDEVIFPAIDALHARSAAMVQRMRAGENVQAEMDAITKDAARIRKLMQQLAALKDVKPN